MGQMYFQGQAGIHSARPWEKLHLIQQGSSQTLFTHHSHVGSEEIFSSNMKREHGALYLQRVGLKYKKLVVSAQLLPRPTFLQAGRANGEESPENCVPWWG